MRSIFIAAAVAFLVSSCESEKPSTPASTPPATPPAATTKTDAVKAETGKVGDAIKDVGAKGIETGKGVLASATKMEVACAHCVYHVPGVSTCSLGVKVAGKPYAVTGVNLDPAWGLCAGPKQATVEGKVEGDKFVATKVDLVK